jgi:hypothetical protein
LFEGVNGEGQIGTFFLALVHLVLLAFIFLMFTVFPPLIAFAYERQCFVYLHFLLLLGRLHQRWVVSLRKIVV